MLVATALILFIMAIISTVFASASKTYSALKTAGDLQERLRTGTSIIRKDLACEHFEGPFITGRSGPRVGDQRMDQPGWMPPPRGYFEIRQFGLPIFEPSALPPLPPLTNVVTDDGTPGGLFSTRAPGGPANGHMIRFTCKLPDGPPSELHCVDVTNLGTFAPLHDRRANAFPPANPLDTSGVLYTRWYEVQYFLQPYSTGETTPPNGAGVTLQLHSLRRRVRFLAPTGVDYGPMQPTIATAIRLDNPNIALVEVPIPGANPAMSMLRLLGPEDVTNPNYRVQELTIAQKFGVDTGDDILMTDVISFEVKAAWFNNQSPFPMNFDNILPGSSPPSEPMFRTTAPPLPVDPSITRNNDAPYDNIPLVNNQRRFDTWFLPSAGVDDVDWERPQGALGTSRKGFLTTMVPVPNAPPTTIPTQGMPPLRINVRSIQIKLRVWESKAEMARQVTIVQEI
jgi:hypothetical protein